MSKRPFTAPPRSRSVGSSRPASLPLNSTKDLHKFSHTFEDSGFDEGDDLIRGNFSSQGGAHAPHRQPRKANRTGGTDGLEGDEEDAGDQNSDPLVQIGNRLYDKAPLQSSRHCGTCNDSALVYTTKPAFLKYDKLSTYRRTPYPMPLSSQLSREAASAAASVGTRPSSALESVLQIHDHEIYWGVVRKKGLSFASSSGHDDPSPWSMKPQMHDLSYSTCVHEDFTYVDKRRSVTPHRFQPVPNFRAMLPRDKARISGYSDPSCRPTNALAYNVPLEIERWSHLSHRAPAYEKMVGREVPGAATASKPPLTVNLEYDPNYEPLQRRVAGTSFDKVSSRDERLWKQFQTLDKIYDTNENYVRPRPQSAPIMNKQLPRFPETRIRKVARETMERIERRAAATPIPAKYVDIDENDKKITNSTAVVE